MVFHENPNSGDGYKNMSQKIYYKNSETNKKEFAFEIQYLTDKEHEKNENMRASGGHFMVELRSFTQRITRLESSMTKDEIIGECQAFVDFYEDRYIRGMPDDFLPQKITFPKYLDRKSVV